VCSKTAINTSFKPFSARKQAVIHQGKNTGFYLKTGEKYPGKTGFAPQDIC
jgi:hypothetical protein